MSSSIEYVEYVCHQINGAGEITYKKMFGEFGIYCDGKIIGLICDDCFTVKKTKAGSDILGECEEIPPYSGAKLQFLIGDKVEDMELMEKFIKVTHDELPEPKLKKKKL